MSNTSMNSDIFLKTFKAGAKLVNLIQLNLQGNCLDDHVFFALQSFAK